VLSQQLADGSSVGAGILGLHRVIVGETFDVIDELHSAEISEYDEIEIARWLLLNDRGMDVNARAEVDSDGVGRHTPLFGCVLSQPYRCGMQRDAAFTRLLLDHGADPNARASLRKRLRFVADESMPEYRDVSPLSWGERFHNQDWVNRSAMRLIAERGGRL
jgi:hypothetical protein